MQFSCLGKHIHQKRYFYTKNTFLVSKIAMNFCKRIIKKILSRFFVPRPSFRFFLLSRSRYSDLAALVSVHEKFSGDNE